MHLYGLDWLTDRQLISKLNSNWDLWTVAPQASLSMEFSRQEYWSGLPFPSPGYLPDPGIEPRSLALQADSLLSEPQGHMYESHSLYPTLFDPMDDTDHGILQTRILEWVAILFSRECSQPRDRTQVSRIAGRFFISWTTREGQVTGEDLTTEWSEMLKKRSCISCQEIWVRMSDVSTIKWFTLKKNH